MLVFVSLGRNPSLAAYFKLAFLYFRIIEILKYFPESNTINNTLIIKCPEINKNYLNFCYRSIVINNKSNFEMLLQTFEAFHWHYFQKSIFIAGWVFVLFWRRGVELIVISNKMWLYLGVFNGMFPIICLNLWNRRKWFPVVSILVNSCCLVFH